MPEEFYEKGSRKFLAVDFHVAVLQICIRALARRNNSQDCNIVSYKGPRRVSCCSGCVGLTVGHSLGILV